MSQRLSFEECVRKAYDKCVRDKSEEIRLREIGINAAYLSEWVRSFMVAQLECHPNPPDFNDPADILGYSHSLMRQGFELGWRARRLYDKEKA